MVRTKDEVLQLEGQDRRQIKYHYVSGTEHLDKGVIF